MAKKTTTHKIKKILIANRGEIACRVMKTCRKMGIATVAVYSDADRKALHVRMADEAVHIGPSPAIESYLVIDKIINAAKDTGADAIHPGYGFLSENPDFVRACQKAKITFIGPAPESMEAMGLKDAAKKLMDKAGVPITPGYHGKDQSPKLLKAKASMIGYPVLIKAVAGGGGKGMRKVEAEEEFEAMLASCQREAKSSFNNDDVLIEKYIQSPRHIEVQVFGDTHGNVVHMFERDCSLQRRHQKVIEEAPAPGMTEAVRKAMTDAAIQAAKAVDYVGAGTVEFIVDGSGKLKTDGFWFMEMNTRLQVEHPVTEMITGLDLVELQIRVAQGEKLPKQKDIKMDGHAVEARLYAEDPTENFRPSAGRLEYFAVRQWLDDAALTARIDTGVVEGDTVTIHYDPMIAKLIAHAPDRTRVIDKLTNDLNRSDVEGPTTNLEFLKALLANQSFQLGSVDTGLIDRDMEKLTTPTPIPAKAYALAAASILAALEDKQSNDSNPWSSQTAFRLNRRSETVVQLIRGGEVLPVRISPTSTGWIARVDDVEHEVLRLDWYEGSPYDPLAHAGHGVGRVTDQRVVIQRKNIFYFIPRYLPGLGSTLVTSNALTAPMPGKIIAVNAKAGDAVKAGDPLIIIEAMKMEMTLEAPRDGVVAEVNAAPDALVTDGEMLLSLEDENE